MADERRLKVPAWTYQQFDADYTLDVPGEGYTGWMQADIDLDPDRTAVVCMHAWDTGTYEEFPGWWRSVDYIPRANAIVETVFPPLLAAVRASSLPLFHVVGGGAYHKELPGYKRAVELAGSTPEAPERIEPGAIHDELTEFRNTYASVGPKNRPDVQRGFARVDFPPPARPLDNEGVAENAHQLFALCKEAGVDHLVYMGFAINWCLLLSAGGMHDMRQRGLLCSALRQATTAVENKESARAEWGKELALWRTALSFGFVFDVEPFIQALSNAHDQGGN